MNRLVVTGCTDPWQNLALEEYLFDTEGEGATLYLWQNENTVVVGRNQNAWKECRTELLESEGGRLARRSSGGGAVFHDLGNLNFTFLLPREAYDLPRQFSVLTAALAPFGIHASASGRNDLVLDTGEKFSGNAFRFTNKTAMHHGTLLVSADMEKLSRYLAPSKRKLAAKGVDSVRSRVKNLSALNASLTVPALVDALSVAFVREYGEAARYDASEADHAALDLLYARYASWDWRYGKTPQFDVSLSERFPWGELELLLTCEAGRVSSVAVFTDAMDETLGDRLVPALTGAFYTPMALADRVRRMESPPAGLADWLAAQVL